MSSIALFKFCKSNTKKKKKLSACHVLKTNSIKSLFYCPSPASPVYFTSIRPSQTTISEPLNKTQSNVVRFVTVTYQKIMQEIETQVSEVAGRTTRFFPGRFFIVPTGDYILLEFTGEGWKIETTRFFDPGRFGRLA